MPGRLLASSSDSSTKVSLTLTSGPSSRPWSRFRRIRAARVGYFEQGRSLQGLAEVAERRDYLREAMQLLDRDAAPYQENGAQFDLGQVLAKKGILSA